jgi:hypothetical protein
VPKHPPSNPPARRARANPPAPRKPPPPQEGAYTLADVRRARPQSALLFNTLFNLHKFLAFENRDPFALRAESLGEDGQATSDWDRWAGGKGRGAG